MVLTPSSVATLIALVLFVLSAFPNTSQWPLVSIGLAFFAAGHLL